MLLSLHPRRQLAVPERRQKRRHRRRRTPHHAGSRHRTITLATTASPKPSSTAIQKVNANYKKFDPKNFREPIGDLNKWYPLVPGTQTLRDGSITRGSRKLKHQLRVTVTDVTKE